MSSTAAVSEGPAGMGSVDSLRIEDLTEEQRTKFRGQSERLQINVLHRLAMKRNIDMYEDPRTGFMVFTKKALQKRECCGNGCRHCPYNGSTSAVSDRQLLGSTPQQCSAAAPRWVAAGALDEW
eukprot:CAMPEP_0204414518 /NCGR_PEP_ID=MMETSP0470-20130426/20791_1 /ASSEMBLY_ACC=CAM_ASM_000385 /TAXON_ID=2969 /ORGANISM="Oxyrrhis marina" /LENGTH=123 /DNA_ID=CAMNT_0051410777 /DNA_START=42 /DNA_END=411 /DNA_ORIENTATION=+